MKDQFIENVYRRIKRISPKVLIKNPNAALWLITAEERRFHPVLYAKHCVIVFLQRFT